MTPISTEIYPITEIISYSQSNVFWLMNNLCFKSLAIIILILILQWVIIMQNKWYVIVKRYKINCGSFVKFITIVEVI